MDAFALQARSQQAYFYLTNLPAHMAAPVCRRRATPEWFETDKIRQVGPAVPTADGADSLWPMEDVHDGGRQLCSSAFVLERIMEFYNEASGAFQKVDTDGSSSIDVEELRRCLNGTFGNGVVFTKQVCKCLLVAYDTDNSGTIELAEFVPLYARVKTLYHYFARVMGAAAAGGGGGGGGGGAAAMSVEAGGVALGVSVTLDQFKQMLARVDFALPPGAPGLFDPANAAVLQPILDSVVSDGAGAARIPFVEFVRVVAEIDTLCLFWPRGISPETGLFTLDTIHKLIYIHFVARASS